MTVTELVEGYGAYSPERKWQPLPITEVHNKLEGLMLELFGVTKRHDVKRDDRNQRGFSGVKFLTEGDYEKLVALRDRASRATFGLQRKVRS